MEKVFRLGFLMMQECKSPFHMGPQSTFGYQLPLGLEQELDTCLLRIGALGT